MSIDYQHRICPQCSLETDLIQEDKHGVWFWICSNPYCDYIKEDDYEDEYIPEQEPVDDTMSNCSNTFETIIH